MKIRAADSSQLFHLADARKLLTQARHHAIEADCPKLTKKIRSALKSLGGAERHMGHRLRRMKESS